MIGTFALLVLVRAAEPMPQMPSSPPLTRPAALQLFERDWVLMNWALKYFDWNHDLLLEPDEARAAAEAFRRIADTNGDGRVTPEEYRSARAFILSRE